MPDIFRTRGRSNTGDAAVVNPGRALQTAQHERDRNIQLDRDAIRNQELARLRSQAMQDEFEKSILKPEVDDVGRFQEFHNQNYLNPYAQWLSNAKANKTLNRGNAVVETQKVKTKGLELAQANKAVDNWLTENELTYPKAYDKAGLDRIITDSILKDLQAGKTVGADDVQRYGDQARQNYESINRPHLYDEFKKDSNSKHRFAELNTDPSGLNRTSQKFKVNPYIDIVQKFDAKGRPVMNSNGSPVYTTRFAGARVFRDQMTDPKLAQLYRSQKERQLSDETIQAAYNANLKEASQIKNPNTKQRAIDELEYKYFIEPFMGNRESWAMKELSNEQIRQFHEKRSLTDSEREIERASELTPVGAENRVKTDATGKTLGNRGKALSLAGTFTKDDAKGISVGGPGQPVYVMKNGYLQKVENPGFKQGVGQNYQITTENVVRGGLFMQDPKTGQVYSVKKEFFNRPSLSRLGNDFYTKRGFMDGVAYSDDLMQAAVEDIKKKGFTPVVYGQNGKTVPVDNASTLFSVGRVRPEPFMRLDVEELQEKQTEKGLPPITVNGKTAAPGVTNILMATPGLSGTVYVPLSDAQTARTSAQRYVGTGKWDADIRKLVQDQILLNQDQYTGSKEGTGVKTPPVVKKKGKIKF